jgi:ribonucleoside-diphosphate reductase alpha chain
MKQTQKNIEDEVIASVPILSVDETQTVDERFTDNTINNILPARYLRKDDNGDIVESPEEMFERVADNVATAEYLYAQARGDDTDAADGDFEFWKAEFETLMKTQRFMPNSPTLMNAGARLQQLAACFVSSPADNLEDIAETEKEWTLVQKTGGGMGGDFSALRPKGALIGTTKGTSSGPVSFMQKFNLVAGVIKQGGVRRGAQMAELRVDHPDIGRFAVCKRNEGAYSNFNISVSVTDEFVEAVENDDMFYFYDPTTSFEETFGIVQDTAHFYSPAYQESPESIVDENLWRDYADTLEAWDWENEETVSFREKWEDHFMEAHESGAFDEGSEMRMPARFIWDIILDGAWRNGEPGLFYLDETRRMHSFDAEEHPEYQVFATNPCAEQPLAEYESCNLGHINLSLMLRDGAPTYDEWLDAQDYTYDSTSAAVYDYFDDAVDFDELDRVVYGGTRFLDNVIDMSEFPLDEITETVGQMRKIGLGVMGWAQMLYQMGIRYGSDASLHMGRILMNYIDERATKVSHTLAEERGSFPAWDKSKYADPEAYPDWFRAHAYELPEAYADGYAMRNHNVTTVAPTGTTSMIGDTSGGIEPVFSVAYMKNVGEDIQGDSMLVEFDKVFIRALEHNEAELDHTVDEIKEIAAEQMKNNEFDGVQGLPIPQWMKDTFVTTNDLTSREHGLMQRVFQDGVDSGISKTVNLPKEATHKDVHDAYMLALSHDELGASIKGLTVYRDQSREVQVLTTQEYSDLEVSNAVEMLEDLGYIVTEPEGGDN